MHFWFLHAAFITLFVYLLQWSHSILSILTCIHIIHIWITMQLMNISLWMRECKLCEQCATVSVNMWTVCVKSAQQMRHFKIQSYYFLSSRFHFPSSVVRLSDCVPVGSSHISYLLLYYYSTLHSTAALYKLQAIANYSL